MHTFHIPKQFILWLWKYFADSKLSLKNLLMLQDLLEKKKQTWNYQSAPSTKDIYYPRIDADDIN